MTKLKLLEVPSDSLDTPQVIELGPAHTPVRPRFCVGRLRRECDLVLQSQYVSKHHFEIVADDKGWSIIDNKSRSGTKLNGIPLKANFAYRLRHGDEIRFCGYLFSWESEEKNESSSNFPPIIPSDDKPDSVILNPGQSWSNLTAASAQNNLQKLLEMICDLRYPENLDQQLRRMIDRLFKLIPVGRRAAVMVKSSAQQTNGFHLVITHPSVASAPEINIRQGVWNDVFKKNISVLTGDKQVIGVPLANRENEVFGLLQLEQLGEATLFAQRDLELLTGAGFLFAIAIENSLHQLTVDRDHRQQQELRTAREIQRNLLPPGADCVGDYEFFGYYDAALQVGGDYYDFVELPNGLLAVALGDVSGKGIPASLLMAKVSSEIRILLDMGCDPAQVLRRVNQRFAERSAAGRFVTLVLLTIDLRDHRLILANAGHPRPLLRHADGRIEELGDAEPAFALGIEAGENYREYATHFPEDATLVLFSDGVTDARSTADEYFNVEGIKRALASAGPSANDAGQSILNAVHAHLGDQPNQDDLCLVCVRRAPHSSSVSP